MNSIFLDEYFLNIICRGFFKWPCIDWFFSIWRESKSVKLFIPMGCWLFDIYTVPIPVLCLLFCSNIFNYVLFSLCLFFKVVQLSITNIVLLFVSIRCSKILPVCVCYEGCFPRLEISRNHSKIVQKGFILQITISTMIGAFISIPLKLSLGMTGLAYNFSNN